MCLRSPAVMAGYWHDPEATRRRVHRRRLRAHRRPRLGRRPGPPAPRRPQQGDVRPRRVQRVPGRGRGGAVRPPGRRRGRDRAAPRPGDGRDRRRRRRAPRPGRDPPTLDGLRGLRARRSSPAYKLPEALRRRRVAAADRRGEGRPQGARRARRAGDRRTSASRPDRASGKVAARMELDFTDEQDELRDAVRPCSSASARPSLVRKLVEKGAGKPPRPTPSGTRWSSSAGPR